MKRFKGSKGTILIIILALLVVGYYYYLSHREVTPKKSDDIKILNNVEKVLMRDLESDYPQTPREVVKYFSEITMCFYASEYSDEELEKLAVKIRQIYDDELVKSQSQEQYVASLKIDVEDYKKAKRVISEYKPSSSLDVETFYEDGYEWARMYCIYTVKEEGSMYPITLKFLLRKDKENHFKIYGWQNVEPTK